MFLLTLSSDTRAMSLMARGAIRYAQLSARFLGVDLEQQSHDVGPLTLLQLRDPHLGHDLDLQTADTRAVALLGHPSCSASSGMPSVHQYMRHKLTGPGPITVDDFTRELQGDFSVAVIDLAARTWEVGIDAVGLSRLFLLQIEGGFILSDTLYLLAACQPLQLDATACAALDLCGYIFGNRTIFEGVALIEMNQRICGNNNSWRIGHGSHFIDGPGGSCGFREVVAAYLDAAAPRFLSASNIRHCMTGGTDSRIVLGLLTHVGVAASVFCWRWDNDDVRLAQSLANEVELDFHSTGRESLLGPEKTEQASVLTQAFLLDGNLPGPFTKRNYLFDRTPTDLITSGSYGEGTVKSTWGIGYAGIAFPTSSKIIERLVAVSAVRRNFWKNAFVRSNAESAVKDYVRTTLQAQAEVVSGADHVKLCNYFYLRNRGARWAAQSLAAAKRLAPFDYPLAYSSGVSATWRVPSKNYATLRLVREMLSDLDMRLTSHPFADGSPAWLQLSPRDLIFLKYGRKLKKGITFVKAKILGMRVTKAKGTFRPVQVRTKHTPLEQLWPKWLTDDRLRRTCDVYPPLKSDVDPSQITQMKRMGHLQVMATLEFATRIYDGEY